MRPKFWLTNLDHHIEFQPAALGVAFLGLVDDRQRAVGVFQAGGFEHQAADVAVEVQEELLADGAVVVEQFGVLAGFVEPDERVRQVEKRDAALADDLQIGRPAERGRFVPLAGRRSCRRRFARPGRCRLRPAARSRASSRGNLSGRVSCRSAAPRGADECDGADDARRLAADDVAAPIDHFDELPHVGRVVRVAVFGPVT